MPHPRILSVATGVPPYSVAQGDVRAFVEALFADVPRLDRYLPAFTNTRIEKRHLSQPLEWFAHEHTFPEANALYEQVALDLITQVSRTALERAAVDPTEIGLVVVASTTGIATPSLDSRLIQALDLSPHTARLPIWGLGCAGGVSGLARAAELTRSLPAGQATLFVAVELTSLTFQRNDFSKSNLIATALFADGAAAVVLRADDSPRPALLASHSTLFPDSEAVMGWDLIATGLKVRFARDIPQLVTDHLPTLVQQATRQWGITPQHIQHYVVHPGGAKVLQAYANSLDLADHHLALAWDVLRDFGNMSSATVLFVLERFLQTPHPPGDYGLMLALGPGFSAEQLLFQC